MPYTVTFEETAASDTKSESFKAYKNYLKTAQAIVNPLCKILPFVYGSEKAVTFSDDLYLNYSSEEVETFLQNAYAMGEEQKSGALHPETEKFKTSFDKYTGTKIFKDSLRAKLPVTDWHFFMQLSNASNMAGRCGIAMKINF